MMNTAIPEQCYSCGYKRQFVDNEFGTLYSFSGSVAVKMTTTLGFRGRGDPELTDKRPLDSRVIAARYGYLVDEVPEALFTGNQFGM